jgi:glucose/arabinose dehydrogenase
VTGLRRRAAAVAALAVAVLGVGCSSDSSSSSPASSGSGGTTLSAACSASTASSSSGSTSPSSASASVTSSSSSSGASALPQLTLTDVAKLDGAPTSVTTRCQEHALYVTLQAGAVVRIDLDASADTPAATLLDMGDLVTAGGEQGLLGLAFSPTGDQLYVSFTNRAQDQELDRFTVTEGGIDATSRTLVVAIPDFAPNHNSGQLLFGPDGYLYWGMGDGGGASDSTKHTGQDPSDLLGNILRLDVLHPAGDKQYSIPSDNPFATSGGAPEVYIYGLRNPWKFSFDTANGDLWIADVGQSKIEEIDHLGGTTKKAGANFGWSAMEGSELFGGNTTPVGILPVFEYSHDTGGCAVIGGFVYRGTKIPDLVGTYLYADNCLAPIGGLRLAEGAGDKATHIDIGLGVGGTSTFGQDVDGEIYVLGLDGTVVRIDSA